jgi:DNA-binding response OmpR family regulator
MVLVVDDNPQNLQFLGNLLESNGYEAILADRGDSSLTILDRELPDLILLDIMMPEMDGYEVCCAIKENQRTKEIPIIFVTAKSEMEDLLLAFKCGAADYVNKPFNSEELLARIKTHVELKLAREEIKTLQGIIPICAKCMKIKDDKGFWNNIQLYIESRTEALFSHGLCPECMKEMYGDQDWYKREYGSEADAGDEKPDQ